MGLYDYVSGTLESLFQINGTGGPNLKGVAGPVLEVRDENDVGYIVTRGANPVGNNDYVTKQYLESSATLQSAYDAGNTVTTAGGTDIALTLTNGGLNVQGSGLVAFGSVTEVSSFSVFSAGTGTFQARDTVLVDMQANNAATKTLTISATNAGGGAGDVKIDADGQVTIGGTNTAASTVQVSGGVNTEILKLAQTTGESFGMFAGTADPSGAVTANAGSLFVRDTGASAELYQNTSATSGTTWTQFSAGGGGITSIDTGNTVWVDSVFGNDGTGATDRQDLPFLTIAAAIAVAVSGDMIRVRGGTYAESGLTLPAGVDLTGDGWGNTEIGDSTAVADIITFTSSIVKDVTMLCPAGAGLAGLKHTSGTGGIYSVNIAGDGGTGSGIGIEKTGTAKLIGGNIRCEQGGFASAILVDSGVLALDDVHFPNTPGQVIDEVLRVEGTGKFQGQGFNCGNTAAVDAVVVAGTAIATIYNPNIFNVANAVHIRADGPTIVFIGGKIEATLRTVWVDPLLTGTGTTVRALSTVLAPLFDFPPAAAVNTQFVLQFNQEATNTRDSRQRLIGADLALGFPELGSAFSVGKGAPYSDGIKVVTTDGTETMVGSVVTGGNQTDVTAEAQSRTSSTYSFQGTAVNNAIYFASLRRDGSSVPLKHWGHILNQVAAGVGGSYVFEIWDGAAWAEIGCMAVSVNEEYRYANEVFLRASSTEELFFGVVAATTWAQSTVGGVAGYYIRARVATTLTTAPTFERCRLSESSTAFNKKGQRVARGLAKWKLVFSAVGFRWSGVGTTTGAITMGAAPVGWNHELEQGKLNSASDDAFAVLALPQGICTAHPIKIRVIYSYQLVAAAPTVGIDLKLCEVVGAKVADPAGGIVPIARTVAATAATDATTGLSDTFTGETMPINTIARYDSIDFDVSDFYEEDIAAIRVTMDADGGGTDILLFGVELEGLQFTDGATDD